jgi:predicted transcriptional regulator
MIIRQLFRKPIDRFIEGVIKADDAENLLNEMEEYIITRDISRKIQPVIEAYGKERTVNGVWISGFFGSGKSHLLKMLSLALEQREIEGENLGRLFHEKIQENIGEIEAADFERCLRIPSESLLFNIDQQADATNIDMESRILGVFLKVFNQHCGYSPNLDFLAQFERDMDREGQLERLRQRYQENTGRRWQDDQPRLNTIRRADFARAYSDVMQVSFDQGMEVLREYRESFNLSLGDFADLIREYIDQKPSGFRLNFFVDEVGQFIAEDVQRMLNLQTLAESLSTRCGGQAWIFVTSQANLETVLGARPGQDFTRIQDRFKVKVSLDGKDVSEVIQLRLLQKRQEAQQQLQEIYDREHDNLRTLFTFGDGNQTYPTLKNGDDFLKTYPFLPYQYTVFQQAMTGLSAHGAFTGQHTSVGERSMLGVFQDVLKEIADLQVPELAKFDQMFAGIRQALQPQYLASVNYAENALKYPFALRLLRALALVKYVDGFKPTPRNLSILLIERPDEDILALQEKVKEALARLEQETYIQRTGEHYSYLTNEEKDVEEKIKSTQIEESQLIKELGELIYNDVLSVNRIRFDDNGQDYAFGRKMDGAVVVGRDAELGVNTVTPLHEHFGNEPVLRAQSTGRSELLVLLPEHPRLLSDLQLYLKTDRFLRTQSREQLPEHVRTIHSEKATQNNQRRKELQRTLRTLLQESRMFVENYEVQVNGDAATRIQGGFQDLIRTAYPNLKMLQGLPRYQETDLQSLLTQDVHDLFGGGDPSLSEAEQEVLLVMGQRWNRGERNTVKALEDVFSAKPYGWSRPMLLALLARLYRKSRLEVRKDNQVLEDRGLLQHLPNTAQGSQLQAFLTEAPDPEALRRLQSLHQDLFSQANSGGDFRAVVREFRAALEHRVRELESWIRLESQYPFVAQVQPTLEQLRQLGDWDDSRLTQEVVQLEERLRDLCEDVLDPITTFMNGNQRKIYDEARSFWQSRQSDLEGLEGLDLTPLRQLEEPELPGQRIQQVKQVMEQAQAQLQEQLNTARQSAVQQVETLLQKLKNDPDLQALEHAVQEQVLQPIAELPERLVHLSAPAGLRDLVRQAEERLYPQVVNAIKHWPATPSPGAPAPPPDVREPPQPYSVVRLQSIKPEFSQLTLDSEDDVEAYLQALRTKLMETLRTQGRIVI